MAAAHGLWRRLRGLVEPHVAAKLYSVGVRTVLMYGTEAVSLSKGDMRKLESTQGKLVKSFLGLKKWCHNTPLLRALRIPSVHDSCALASLSLLRSCLMSNSRAAQFYNYCLNYLDDTVDKYSNLVSRCLSNHLGANTRRFLLNSSYAKSLKSDLYYSDCDGLVDSVRALFQDYSDNARNLLQLLLNPF